jgi:hypothetical protein
LELLMYWSRFVFAFLAIGSVALASGRVRAAEGKSKEPLDVTLDRWITLVEKDDLTAAKQFTATPEAATKLQELWPQVRECHKRYDYRRWLERVPEGGGAGAKAVGGAKSFTVGGHSFGHLHVKWEKADDRWQIADVFMCR